MKLTILLLTTALMNFYGGSYAQSISFKGRNIALEKVFSEIRKQTGHVFFYEESILKGTHPVTIDVKDVSLDEILKILLKDQPLQYRVLNKTIIISKKEAVTSPPKTVEASEKEVDPHMVNGVVLDGEGRPLAGATIAIKQGRRSAKADAEGRFTILASPGDILLISYTGYETRQVPVSAVTEPLVLTLTISNSRLDEVQVIAYGTTTGRMNVGSITTVKSEEIQVQPVADVLQALEANVPGLNITQNSGMAGSGYTTIQIRGVNSITSGSTPLFIIDGVQVTGADQFAYGINPFDMINPSDIESVSILKDADATAIYGSRGANGVILITTKKGKAGSSKATANFSQGINRLAHGSEFLNTEQYLLMRNEAYANDGETPDSLSAPDLFGYGVGADPHLYTDWQRELIGHGGHMTDAQLSVSGGTGRTTFHIGAALHRESPTMPAPFSYQRPSLYFNLNHGSNDQRFNINLMGSYSVTTSNFGEEDVSWYTSFLPPNLPPLKNADGTFNFYQQMTNPFALMAEPTKVTNKNLLASSNISYRILPGLEIRSGFGYSNINRYRMTLVPAYTYDPAYGLTSGAGSFDYFNEYNWQIEPQLEYSHVFGRGKLTALVGGTYQGRTTEEHFIYATDYNGGQLEDYSTASSVTARPSYTNYRYAAAFTRMNFEWQERYLVNLTGRRDGSSRFGPGRQFGDFGAVAAGWVFSKEDFALNKLSWLSFGKFRASYGVTGNDQIGDYQYLDTYSPTRATAGISGASTTGIRYAGQATISPTALYNPDYGWETTRKLDIGLDLGFLRDRVLFNVDWYRNRSSSQLVNYTVPPTTGFPSILRNLPAVVGNEGWEFVLNTVNVKGTAFSWSTALNVTVPKNKLVSFPDFVNSSYNNTYVIGQPLSIHKVYRYLGVDTHTGLYTFADKEGKPTSAPTPIVDQTSLVNTDRRWYGGLSNTFRYKGLQLIVLLQYVHQKNYDIAVYGQPPGAVGNFVTKVMSRWQKEGDKTTIQRFTQNTSTDAYTAGMYVIDSERAFADGNFLRVKNVSLSYDLGKGIAGRLHSKALRVYVNAQNLLTVTPYSGADPETGGSGFLPPMRTIVGGIQCTF